MKKSLFTFSWIIGVAAIIISCSNGGPTQVSAIDGTGNIVATFSSKTLMSNGPYNDFYPSMAASLGWPGNLEVVRRTASGTALEHLYWSPGNTTWNVSATFGSNPVSDPALCVNRADNYLQVVVREASNPTQLHHYWRENSGEFTWHSETFFGSNCTGSPAMICNIEPPYNLEVLVKEGNQIKHIYRDQNHNWISTEFLPNGGYIFTDEGPTLTQTPDGLFHAVATGRKDSRVDLIYWIRELVNNTYVWRMQSTIASVDSTRPGITALSDNGVEIVYKKYNYPTVYQNYLFFLNAPQTTHQLTDDDFLYFSSEDWRKLKTPSITTLNGIEIHASFLEHPFNNQHWKLIH